jgi:hypothetical protein
VASNCCSYCRKAAMVEDQYVPFQYPTAHRRRINFFLLIHSTTHRRRAHVASNCSSCRRCRGGCKRCCLSGCQLKGQRTFRYVVRHLGACFNTNVHLVSTLCVIASAATPVRSQASSRSWPLAQRHFCVCMYVNARRIDASTCFSVPSV